MLHAAAGTIVELVGPNGSGKSTLLRTVYRVLRPTEGIIQVGGDPVWQMSARQAARRTAVLTQDSPADFDFTVSEIVALGRVPHKGLLQRTTITDEQIITDSLARALAQQPKVLVLDEPTNHLDIAAQLDLLELVRSLGITVVTAVHDLNLASSYCDQVFVLNAGRVVTSGSPEDVFTPDLLLRVFGVRAHCETHPLTGRPLLAFAPTTKEIR